MIEKSPSKPRIYVEPEIIGAGKFVRGVPCSRRSFVRTGRKIRRNALKSLVWQKENDAWVPVFLSLEPVFFETKSARLAHKRALSRWPHAEERRPTRHLEGKFRERPRADSLRPPKRSSTPLRGAERSRGNEKKGRES
jgi:hypothetical protein